MSFNTVVALGRLGRDVESRQVGDKTVFSFNVATSRRFTSKGEKVEKTTWFRVQAWDRIASGISPYLVKGREVLVNGTLEQEDYTDKDGNPRTSFTLNASNITLVGSAPKDGNDSSSKRDDWSDDDDGDSSPPWGK